MDEKIDATIGKFERLADMQIDDIAGAIMEVAEVIEADMDDTAAIADALDEHLCGLMPSMASASALVSACAAARRAVADVEAMCAGYGDDADDTAATIAEVMRQLIRDIHAATRKVVRKGNPSAAMRALLNHHCHHATTVYHAAIAAALPRDGVDR